MAMNAAQWVHTPSPERMKDFSSLQNLGCFYYLLEMSPRFSELNKVRVKCPQSGEWEGYVIASQFRDGRWIYKVSLTEDPKTSETFDNWYPEESLELTK